MSIYLSEAGGPVGSGAVDENRVEEHSVAGTHLQVHPGVAGVVVMYAVVHLVHTTLKQKGREDGAERRW